MKAMFSNCLNLIEIKGIKNFNIINVMDNNSMFQKRNSLVSLNLNFDTSKVTNM